jgi:hypothetical protein
MEWMLLTLRRCKMKNISILSEHIELLHTGNRLHIQFLQSCLKFSVVLPTSCFHSANHLTTRSSLAACSMDPEMSQMEAESDQ